MVVKKCCINVVESKRNKTVAKTASRLNSNKRVVVEEVVEALEALALVAVSRAVVAAAAVWMMGLTMVYSIGGWAKGIMMWCDQEWRLFRKQKGALCLATVWLVPPPKRIEMANGKELSTQKCQKPNQMRV